MKKTFLFAAAMAVLCLSSCKKDEKPQVPGGPDEPETPGLVNTDVNNWKLYENGFYEGVSSATMSEVEEGDETCLKWVFAKADAWANYGVLDLDPYLDLKDADVEKACLKFRFKVEKDGGPAAQHTLFRIYFGASDGNNAVDYWPGAVGRGEASLEWYNIVVNDNEWHELSLPLKDYISKLSGVGSARQLGFTPKDAPAAAGTTVLFNNIRLENCAVSHPSSDEPSVDPTPDTPKEFTALIYDDAISGTWVLDGTAGKFTETADEHSTGTKSVKWYCESAWFNSACVFRLPKGETKDISSYSKLKFDVKIQLPATIRNMLSSLATRLSPSVPTATELLNILSHITFTAQGPQLKAVKANGIQLKFLSRLTPKIKTNLTALLSRAAAANIRSRTSTSSASTIWTGQAMPATSTSTTSLS